MVSYIQKEGDRLKQSFFIRTAAETAGRSRLAMTDRFIQHGNVTCLLHTVAVAYYSYYLFKKIPFLRLRRRELVRGALLHDYFLYDWHTPDPSHRLHGFTHPKTALANAERDLALTETERDIIAKHMFPLTPKPPMRKESVIVCLVDKICSLYEVFKRNPYRNKELRLAYARIKKP